MYERISLKDMSREDWLRLRKTGIGGSDAGAICGLNPYTSKMKVFLDKTSDEIKDCDNEVMRLGRDLEEYVAERFTEATGLKVRRSNFLYRSKRHPFMIADPDRILEGGESGLECKIVNTYSADQWEDGKIPPHYYLQCQHYLAVTGKRSWYICAVILGKGIVYHEIERDDELIRVLVNTEKEFWNDYVLAGVMPEPDGSSSYTRIINEQYSEGLPDSRIELDGSFNEELERREQILELIDELEKEQEQIEQEIKLAMADNEFGFTDRFKVSWKNVSSSRLDSKRLKLEHPDMYEEYTRESITRRFQIKAA